VEVRRTEGEGEETLVRERERRFFSEIDGPEEKIYGKLGAGRIRGRKSHRQRSAEEIWNRDLWLDRCALFFVPSPYGQWSRGSWKEGIWE
jgi:hypothetical protein